jgi:hypothetical protein
MKGPETALLKLFEGKPNMAACLHIPFAGIKPKFYEAYLCYSVTGGRVVVISLCNDL